MFLGGSSKYPLSDPAQVSELCARKYQLLEDLASSLQPLVAWEPKVTIDPREPVTRLFPSGRLELHLPSQWQEQTCLLKTWPSIDGCLCLQDRSIISVLVCRPPFL